MKEFFKEHWIKMVLAIPVYFFSDYFFRHGVGLENCVRQVFERPFVGGPAGEVVVCDPKNFQIFVYSIFLTALVLFLADVVGNRIFYRKDYE